MRSLVVPAVSRAALAWARARRLREVAVEPAVLRATLESLVLLAELFTGRDGLAANLRAKRGEIGAPLGIDLVDLFEGRRLQLGDLRRRVGARLAQRFNRRAALRLDVRLKRRRGSPHAGRRPAPPAAGLRRRIRRLILASVPAWMRRAASCSPRVAAQLIGDGSAGCAMVSSSRSATPLKKRSAAACRLTSPFASLPRSRQTVSVGGATMCLARLRPSRRKRSLVGRHRRGATGFSSGNRRIHRRTALCHRRPHLAAPSRPTPARRSRSTCGCLTSGCGCRLGRPSGRSSRTRRRGRGPSTAPRRGAAAAAVSAA